MASSHPSIGDNQTAPGEMRAATYQKKRAGESMIVKSVAIPTLGPDEVLVRMAAASLCGSDTISYKGYLGPKTEGLIAGHEGVGIVAAIHPSVTWFAVGDRVGFTNCLRTCGNCTPCLGGHAQFCESGKVNQGFDVHGFLAEYAVVKAQFTILIPQKLPLERLTPLFCAGITAFSALKKLDIPQRGVIGVFGLGGVGLFAVQFAKAMGFQVLGFDVSEEALKNATRLGADEAVKSTDEGAIADALQKYSVSEGLHGAVVTTAVQAAFTAAIAYTGFNGTIVAVGVPQADISISVYSFIKKGLKLQGTQAGSPLELKQMMSIVDAHNIIPEIELSSIETVPELMEQLAGGKATGKLGIVF